MRIATEALSVVVAQYDFMDAASYRQVEENIDRLEEMVLRAVSGFPGVDLVVTPECSVQGVHAVMWDQVLLTYDSPQMKRLQQICAHYDLWGVFNPWMKSESGSCENTVIIINGEGTVVHSYVKSHPWIPLEVCKPGNVCPVCSGPKGSRIMTLLSSDAEYPEVWEVASRSNANIVIRLAHYMDPIASGFRITNEGLAIKSGCCVIGCSAVGLDDQYSYIGTSSIIGCDGNTIVEAPHGVLSIIKADVYPGVIDYYRKGNKRAVEQEVIENERRGK